MTETTPRRSGLGDALVVGIGVILGVVAGSFCCAFGVGLTTGLELPPVVYVLAGIAVFAFPLFILIRRRPTGQPFTIGLLIGLCLAGLLLGACGTLLMG